MTLPMGFWEEFDRRLDAKLEEKLEQKLEAKFTEKLKPIYKQLDELKDWTRQQDFAVERETSIAVTKHLMRMNTGYIVVTPRIFPKTINGTNGLTLTEFDGVVVLTKDPDFASYLRGDTNGVYTAPLNTGKADSYIPLKLINAPKMT